MKPKSSLLVVLFGILSTILLMIMLGEALFSSASTVGERTESLQMEILEATVTAYSPSKVQTQGHPRQMASGKHASVRKLWEMRYVAVSRDLKEKYGLEYGDSIFLEFELQDLMGETAVGKKVENTVDLFLRNQELARQFGRQERRIIVFSRGE